MGDPRGLPRRPERRVRLRRPAGHPRLREVLAAYLRRVRAADTSAGQVIICSGMAQGLGLVLRALAGQG